MILAPLAILELARNAGFPPTVDVTMTAIALRESGGDPAAHNGNAATGDDSYGLWQINWKVLQVRNLLVVNGITDPQSLLDPAINAKAAFLLYGGKVANLNIAWYINRPGSYQDRYNAHLPAAQAAALASRMGTT